MNDLLSFENPKEKYFKELFVNFYLKKGIEIWAFKGFHQKTTTLFSSLFFSRSTIDVLVRVSYSRFLDLYVGSVF